MRKHPLSARLAGGDPKDPAEKNFGAFPVDIPEDQFDDFFL